MAIKISFQSNVSDVVRGTEKIAKGLDDMSDELRDVADEFDDASRDADRALDKIDDGLKDAGDGADKFEDDVRKAMDRAADHADTASKKIGTDAKKGFDKAGEGVEEFRRESDSTAKEAAASFDGSAESIADAFQEVSANALAGFGPAGAIAGLAIAAGLGIAIKKVQELAEENTEAKETMAELAGEIHDAGGRLDQIDFASKIRDFASVVEEDNPWTFWVDEAETNLEKYSELAEQAGVDTATAVRAMAGPLEDAKGFLEDTAGAQDELTQAVADGTRVTRDGVTVYTDEARAAKKKLDALDELRGVVEENIGTQEDAVEQEELTREATQGTTDALREKVEALDEVSDRLSDSISSELDYLDQLDKTTEAIEENGSSLDKNTAAGRDNWRSLIDLKDAALDQAAADLEAGEAADVVAGKIAAQREEFIKAAEAAGATERQAKDLADQWGLTPKEVSTTVTAKTKDAEGTVDEFVTRGRTARVDVDANTDAASNAIARLNGSIVTVTARAFMKYGQAGI